MHKLWKKASKHKRVEMSEKFENEVKNLRHIEEEL